MTNGGGDHGSEEEARQKGGSQEAGEEVGEVREEVRQVSLPAAKPGVGKEPIYFVDAGRLKIVNVTLPEGVRKEDVTISSLYEGEDENMRMVRAVNEDPPDALKMTIRKQVTVPAYVDRITISIDTEKE